MTFKIPRSALPPEKTLKEKIEFHLTARDQYQRLRAAYAKWFKEQYFRLYGHNSTETPPEGEGEGE